LRIEYQRREYNELQKLVSELQMKIDREGEKLAPGAVSEPRFESELTVIWADEKRILLERISACEHKIAVLEHKLEEK
jgi:hypothetical protein